MPAVLNEIDEEEYLSILDSLLTAKGKVYMRRMSMN